MRGLFGESATRWAGAKTPGGETSAESAGTPTSHLGSASTGASRAAQAARRQALFREVNERIMDVSGRAPTGDIRLIICECSDPRCARMVEIGARDYEDVRASRGRFVVARRHAESEFEHVVTEHGSFQVVETREGSAIVATDLRRR